VHEVGGECKGFDGGMWSLRGKRCPSTISTSSRLCFSCSLSLATTDEQLEIFYGEENSGMSMAPSFQFLLVLVMILPGQKRQEK
jgi:hypothetical protein